MSGNRYISEPARARNSRSRVTNGSLFEGHVDQRTCWARRFRDVFFEILQDMGGDTNGNLSEAQRQIARRCAALAVECEAMEAQAASGERINLDLYGMLVDRIGRSFQRIGITRQARDITPSLGQYLDEAAE